VNLTLLRHHPLLRGMYVKWLVLGVALASFWVGVVAGWHATAEIAPGWWTLTAVWLPAAMFLAFGGQTTRTRPFALGLPITGRRVWAAHAAAVLLTSGAMLAACLAVETYALLGLRRAPAAGPLFASGLDRMGHVWLHAGAWWLLLCAFVLHDRPHLAEVPRDRRWLASQAAGVAAMTAGLMVASPLLGWPVALLAAVAAAALAVRTWRRIPISLVLADREARRAVDTGVRGPMAAPLAWWRRQPLWLVVVMQTSKYPALLVMSAPFVVLMGLWTSPASAHVTDGLYLGILFASIGAYMLFSVAASPLVRLASFDHLPVSRARLLASLMVPTIVLLGGGYLAGEIIVAQSPPRSTEPIDFYDSEQDFGVMISGRFLDVAWGDPPPVTTPDGQIIVPPPTYRPFGAHGPTIYKPYYTPAGASLATCAWQLERATARVFDRPIPAAELQERYLAVAADGRVVLRDGELPLLRDFPDRQVRGFPGLSPLVAISIIVQFVAAYAFYLTRFRPDRSERSRRASFVGLLVLLMGLYLLPFALDVSGLGGGDQLVILAHWTSERLVATVPGGVTGLWILVGIIAAVGYRLLLHGFRRAEWPPVREDDTVYDVLG